MHFIFIGLVSLIFIKSEECNRIFDYIVVPYCIFVLYLMATTKRTSNDPLVPRVYESKKKKVSFEPEGQDDWKNKFDGIVDSVKIITTIYKFITNIIIRISHRCLGAY
jgi:hypothetical protein